MSEPNSMSEGEMDAAIDQELIKRERDPQLRIAEALEEIAIQLQRLNENQIKVISTEEADRLINGAVKRHGLPVPETSSNKP